MKNFRLSPFTITTLFKFLHASLNYVSLLLIAQVFTTEDFGKIAIIFATVFFLTQVASLGQPQVILRFWYKSKDLSKEDASKFLYNRFLINGFGLIIVTSIFPLFLGYTNFSSTEYFIICLGLLNFAIAELNTSLGRVQERLIVAFLPRDVGWKLSVILLCVVSIGLETQITANTFLLLNYAFLFIFVLPQSLFLFGQIKTVGFTQTRNEGPNSGLSWFYFWMSNIMNSSGQNAYLIIFSWYLNAVEVGILFAVIKTAQAAQLLQKSAAISTASLFSNFFHQNKTDASLVHLKGISKRLVIMNLGILFVVVTFGEYILKLFGEEFGLGYYALVILSVGSLIRATFGPNLTFLQMSNDDQIAFWISGASFIIPFLCIPYVVGNFEIIGAVVLLVAHQLMLSLLSHLVVQRIYIRNRRNSS